MIASSQEEIEALSSFTVLAIFSYPSDFFSRLSSSLAFSMALKHNCPVIISKFSSSVGVEKKLFYFGLAILLEMIVVGHCITVSSSPF